MMFDKMLNVFENTKKQNMNFAKSNIRNYEMNNKLKQNEKMKIEIVRVESTMKIKIENRDDESSMKFEIEFRKRFEKMSVTKFH